MSREFGCEFSGVEWGRSSMTEIAVLGFQGFTYQGVKVLVMCISGFDSSLMISPD